MKPTDEAILRLLPQIDRMISAGLKPEFVSDGVRPYVEAAASLSLHGHEPNWLSVKLMARGKIDHVVKDMFGQGGVDLDTTVKLAKNHNLVNQLSPIIDEIKVRLRSDGESVDNWMPAYYRRMSSLVKDGVQYSALPSDHFKQPIPQVHTKFNCFLDDIMRGGIFSGALGVIAAVPGDGKSTMAYTIAAHCASNGVKVVLITGEEMESFIVARILMAQSFATMDETLLFQKMVNNEEDYPLDRMINGQMVGSLLWKSFGEQESLVRIYNAEHGMDVDKMDTILAWERPGVLIIDHIMMVEDKKAKGVANSAFDIGDKMYRVRNMVVQKYGIQGVIFSQVPDSVGKQLKKGKMPQFATMYGSGMINQASHWTALMGRHPDSLRQGYNRLWYQKSKIGNNEVYGERDVFAIRHDMKSQSFISAEEDRWG